MLDFSLRYCVVRVVLFILNMENTWSSDFSYDGSSVVEDRWKPIRC